MRAARRSPRASFSARSAAVAWSASGRRRFRTSASTSRARSTWIPTRFSFSSARCWRRLNLPRPAASSTSSRRSSGFEASTASTLPWLTIECIEPPSPTSASSSTRSVRRTCALLTRYWPSPPRWSRRAIETSEKSSSPNPPLSLSKTSSTSQLSAGVLPSAPLKRTSSGFSARSSDGVSEPAAQTIASATFDLPEPFGPTTTATPGSSFSSSVSGNDLKPRRRRERRCTGGRLTTAADGDRPRLGLLGHAEHVLAAQLPDELGMRFADVPLAPSARAHRRSRRGRPRRTRS